MYTTMQNVTNAGRPINKTFVHCQNGGSARDRND